MAMKLIDFFKKLGIFVENPYSKKFNGNLLPAKLYIRVYIDGIWYGMKVEDVDFTTDDGRVHGITFIAKEKPPIEISDEELEKEIKSAMRLMGGY